MGTAGAGCHNITVSQVQRPLASGDPTQQHYSMELAEAVVAEYRLDWLDLPGRRPTRWSMSSPPCGHQAGRGGVDP
ncbi:MAG: hypothetical protein M5R42_20190 [Rhodocyclaceae bacterium]|nr:hypothetical protein [Rhodocyclaceae bacterium]